MVLHPNGDSVGDAGAAAVPAARSQLPFEFTGNAREYFGIWIVNSLLSLLTLGVYSAWAKVVQRRYFYRNTWVAGASFEYLADPRRVLLGRALIVSVLGLILFAKYYSIYFYLGAIAMAALAAPWAFVLAFRFNARNSAYRGVRFAFHGSTKDAYLRSLVLALGYVPCGLGYPFARHRLTRFVTTSHGLGNQRFSWLAEARQYYSVYILALAMLLPGVLVFIAVVAMKLPEGVAITSLLLYAYLLIPATFLKTELANLVYGELRLGRQRLRCNQKFGKLLGLYVTNLLAIALSAGLLIPWAQIRVARFRASALVLVAAGELEVKGAPGDDGAAFGDAATDLGGFDLDLGL